MEGVSRHHAELSSEPEGWRIRDLNSKNGLLINGACVTEHTLRDGDRIRLGAVELTCKELGTAVPTRTPAVEIQEEEQQAIALTIEMARFDTLLLEAPVVAPTTRTADLDGTTVARIFYRAAESLLSSDDLDETLEAVLDLVFEHLPAQRGSLSSWDPDTATLTPLAFRAQRDSPEAHMRLSRTVARTAVESRRSVLIREVAQEEQLQGVASLVELEITSAMCAPLIRDGQVRGLVYVDTGDPDETFDESHLEVLSALSVLSAVAIAQSGLRDQARTERQVRSRLARYSSAAVVDKIVAAGNVEGEMLAEEVEVSVLFADICGFTSLAERLGDPLAVMRLLNNAFEHLVGIVFEHEGTLDKFIGDELMAFFGAPLHQPDQALRSVHCAQDMLRRLSEYNEAHPDQEPLGMTVGINTGPAVVGDVGTRDRRDYTVIGDTVNTAKRIETYAAERGRIAIGENTYRALDDRVACSFHSELHAKGKREFVRVWTVDP
jgi:adenylate cyclase